jgi:hypothetical protein
MSDPKFTDFWPLSISKIKIASETLKGQKLNFWPFEASEAILILLMKGVKSFMDFRGKTPSGRSRLQWSLQGSYHVGCTGYSKDCLKTLQ